MMTSSDKESFGYSTVLLECHDDIISQEFSRDGSIDFDSEAGNY